VLHDPHLIGKYLPLTKIQGPRSSGGIGDMMIRQSYLKSRDMYYVRFFYDVTCFIIINIIFMNIIFGIIIDTFAELRNKKNSDAKLMSKSCTICSVENTEVKSPLPLIPLV
jgi:hypothetical protein